MPRGAAVNVGLLPAEPAAQRHRCVCPCKSLDCVKLSQKEDKRLSVYKTWGWTRRQIADFEGRLLDGHAKLHNFYVAIEHFAPGDRIVRSGSGERLQQVRGLGVASRGFVPGQPGEPGRFTPSAVPAVTPRTGDRAMSDVAATALEELDRSAADASPADAAAATAAALSVRRELGAAHAANAQLQRRVDALQAHVDELSAAPVWRRVGENRKRSQADASQHLGYLSPCMRWERVRDVPARELKSLIGFGTARQFESLIAWMDADGLYSDARIISSDQGRAAVRDAGAPAPAGERAQAPARVRVALAGPEAGGRPRELSVLDWSFLSLYIVRQDCSQAHAAYTFGISEAQVGAYFSTWFCLADEWLDVQMPMPSAEALASTTPPAWRKRLGAGQGVVIVDATPIRTQAPKDSVTNAFLYGSYYSGTAMKVQVATNPLGAAVHVTSGVGGSVSDDNLAAFSGVVTDLPPGTTILADRGYVQLATNGDMLARGSCIIRPQFRTAHDDAGDAVLTGAQVSSTANIANMRSVVERVNGAAKKIFPWLCRKHHLQQLDVVAVVTRVLFRFASFWPVLLDVTQTVEESNGDGSEPRATKRRRVPSLVPGQVGPRIVAGGGPLAPPHTPGAGAGAGAGAGGAGAGAGGSIRRRSLARRSGSAGQMTEQDV